MDFNKGVQRLVELTTLFSRCRRERNVPHCLTGCECPYKQEHDEYWAILNDRKIFKKGNPEVDKLLPVDVLAELKKSRCV